RRPVVASGRIVFVDTDGNACAVGRDLIGRNLEVVRGGHVGVDAAGEVKGGAVAGAEEAALPICGQTGACTGGQLRRGRTAKVSTDTHGYEVFRIARTVLVFGVFRRKAGAI